MDLRLQLYSELILKITRGNYRGVFSNAKPIYLLALIDSIPFLKFNKIKLEIKLLNDLYSSNLSKYDPNCKASLTLPFFHLDTEPFYELVWKSSERPKTHAHTPSATYLREYLDYAKLDDDLWCLLQDENNRKYLRDCIINHFFDQ